MSTNTTTNAPAAPALVNLTIDGKSVAVPKGTNLIEAARAIGIEVPHYCYHPHLSVPGNCRMCQVEVKGQPKLNIGCNTTVAEGMEVLTQNTSKKAEEAQAATLEFILINHPLDCTVCDQAGHCKLQDYHFEYNAKPSRFLEEKEHKVKAEPLGPTVMLDGERCIMCTRCVRFCDEVTGTSELGLLNRGDRTVIAISEERELDNPLSGSVVDLCPVGALTHRAWRFNTRIWFTKQTDSICPGCSTGCNANVAVRDGEVVQVKARLNSAVNKEWMCDEGRYGFGRFLPKERVIAPTYRAKVVALNEAVQAARALSTAETLVFLSPDLLTEEYAIIKNFLDTSLKNYRAVLAYRERALSKTEALLVSPDYAANFRGAEFVGIVSGDLTVNYESALKELVGASKKNVLMVGDRAILEVDQSAQITSAISAAPLSVALLCDASSGLAAASTVVLPARSILEKSGLLINRQRRLQYAERALDAPDGTLPTWQLVNQLGVAHGAKLSAAQSDRDLTIEYLAKEARLAGLRIARIKKGGIALESYKPGSLDPSGGSASSVVSTLQGVP